jgi:hypothetical protein
MPSPNPRPNSECRIYASTTSIATSVAQRREEEDERRPIEAFDRGSMPLAGNYSNLVH